mgnify:FL=1
MNEISIGNMIQIEQKEYKNMKTKEYKNLTIDKNSEEEKLEKEDKEIYTINNTEYTVISKKTENSLGKEKLIDLIVNYAIQELKHPEQ